MGYSEPTTITFSLGLIDFTSEATLTFALPVGMRGRLKDVIVIGSVAFTATTTEAELNIGSTSGGEEYANCGMGTTAATGVYRMTANTADLIEPDITADANFYVDIVAPTGGTPAGSGFVNIVIDCFKG